MSRLGKEYLKKFKYNCIGEDTQIIVCRDDNYNDPYIKFSCAVFKKKHNLLEYELVEGSEFQCSSLEEMEIELTLHGYGDSVRYSPCGYSTSITYFPYLSQSILFSDYLKNKKYII